MLRLAGAAGMVLGLIGLAVAHGEPLRVVAAENFYGDVAEQLGGAHVTVSSILTKPDQDPHLFEASASTARAIAAARIVIYNGANYDPWMVKLLSASQAGQREVIELAALLHRKIGDNPHLWYDPATMPALARDLSARLARLDPDNRADYEERMAAFQTALARLSSKIAELRQKYAGTPVAATEPVFGYMAEAIGLDMRNRRFQLAVMNGTEPGAAEIAAFERDLKTRTVKLLLYNNQTSERLTMRLRSLARSAGIPVVGVGETAPPATHFQDWMLAELAELDAALSGQPQ